MRLSRPRPGAPAIPSFRPPCPFPALHRIEGADLGEQREALADELEVLKSIMDKDVSVDDSGAPWQRDDADAVAPTARRCPRLCSFPHAPAAPQPTSPRRS